MKKVFSNSDDAIHLFAQQTQSEGRTSSNNIFFKNQKIYSYGHHYLLGEFVNDKTIVINDIGYSVTTSKHISKLRYATRQYKQFFKTEIDLDRVYNSIQGLKDKLARARKPEGYINQMLYLWDSINEFAEWECKEKNIFKKDYILYSTDKYNEIKRIITALNSGSEEYKLKLAKVAKEQAKAQKIKDTKALKESLIKFNEYKINSFRIGNEDFLRLSKDLKSVETSQGVTVAREEALQLYKAIKLGIDIKGYRIGYYTVNSINGTLKIGCHSINIESMHLIGGKLIK